MNTIAENRWLRTVGWMMVVVGLWWPLLGSTEEMAPPQRVVKQISDQLSRLLTAEPERLDRDPEYLYRVADRIIAPHVDFSRVSRLVLGKHWRRASPDQRARFVRELQRLVVRTYSTAFKTFGEWQIHYFPVRMSGDGKRAAVRIKVTRPGAEPVEVAYHMHLKDGRWLAYDVKVDGISLITNYRSTFSREIRKVGLDGLIEKLSSMNGQHLADGRSGGSDWQKITQNP